MLQCKETLVWTLEAPSSYHLCTWLRLSSNVIRAELKLFRYSFPDLLEGVRADC